MPAILKRSVAAENTPVSRSVAPLPPATEKPPDGGAEPLRVIRLITPPTASEPYRLPPPPRSTSTRSKPSGVRLAKSNAPRVTLLTCTPSISTSTSSTRCRG